MERETKNIQTPNKHEVVIKTYITGREKREIQNIFLNEVEMNVVGKQANMTNIKGDLVARAEEKTIELLVVSVDGKTENIVDLVLDLNSEDSDFITDAINEMTSKKKEDDISTA